MEPFILAFVISWLLIFAYLLLLLRTHSELNKKLM
ncbi:MAG: CcmD family protein [Methanosarcina sp.]